MTKEIYLVMGRFVTYWDGSPGDKFVHRVYADRKTAQAFVDEMKVQGQNFWIQTMNLIELPEIKSPPD